MSEQKIRKIIHIDMDCFYAAVEERERPELIGKPIVVGGDPFGRGVVATANYPARKFGIKSAMPSARAHSLCPHAIFIRPRFHLYKTESRYIRQIFSDYTELVEPLSLDEAYLDVTESKFSGGVASKIAEAILGRIKNERNLSASAGVGPSKFVAKLASEFRKPGGLTVVVPAKVDQFVAGLPIDSVPGIGKVTASKIREMGFETCNDLRKLSEPEMIRAFGKWGAKLYRYVRGIDERPVKTDSPRKSISVENTFDSDLSTKAQIEIATDELFRDLMARIERVGVTSFRALFVKVKFFDFEQTTLERHEFREPDLNHFTSMMIEAWQRHDQPVRLLGLGVRLHASEEPANQLLLFDQ